ncbi:MAG: hypothetical protein GX129_05825 [Clostridiales bacterium]|nr:hypothetical protein [Clostridiales bacterium]
MINQKDIVLKNRFLPVIEYTPDIQISTLIEALKIGGYPILGIITDSCDYIEIANEFNVHDCSTFHITKNLRQELEQNRVYLLELQKYTDKLNSSKELGCLIKNQIFSLLELSLIHVGINTADDTESGKVAALYKEMLNLPSRETPGSFFVGTVIEVMKGPFLGKCGHIGFGTANISLAYFFFCSLGYKFIESTIVKDEAGQLSLIYFGEELGNFAVHLKQL